MRKIPLKNYIILGIIIVVSVFAVLYFNKLYKNTKNSETVLYGFIKEVKPYELDNYITENPNFIMYLSSRISSNKSFEKKFKKFLMKYDLQKYVIFIDIDEFGNQYFETFISKYSGDSLTLKKFNNIIIIDNQKIQDVLFMNEEQFDIDLVKKLFKENGVY